MEVRLTFNGAAPEDPAVTDWFAAQNGPLAALAFEWWVCMRGRGEEVLELLHDGCPVACIEDVPFAYVNAFTRHVNVGFFNGAFLPDPAGVLIGTGKRMRHVKLWPDVETDADALTELIQAAYRDARAYVAARVEACAGSIARSMRGR